MNIPIFFSCDDNYIPYLTVTIQSIVDHMNDYDTYSIYVLHKGISEKNMLIVKEYEKDNLSINFISLEEKIKYISDLLDDVRDYYTQTIFYRLFIAGLFKSLTKAIYLDCDIIVNCDLAELYNIDLKGNTLGCVVDNVVRDNDDFKIYTKATVGVESHEYFNSGVLLIDLVEYRKNKIEEKFLYMLEHYVFKSVAPDQDFLNYVCKDSKLFIEEKWNRMPIDDGYDDEIKIIHFNMFMKPWLYDNVIYEDYFWNTAKRTPFYDQILAKKKSYTEEEKKNDLEGVKRMVEMCYEIINSRYTYNDSFEFKQSVRNYKI